MENAMTEKTRLQAMKKLGVTRMPRKVEPDDGLYTAALVKVLKTDGKEYWCVRDADFDGRLRIKCDFEPTYGIREVLEVRPTETIKAEIDGKPLDKMPRKEKEKWLTASNNWKTRMRKERETVSVDVGALTDEELDDLCVRVLRIARKTIEMGY